MKKQTGNMIEFNKVEFIYSGASAIKFFINLSTELSQVRKLDRL